MTKYLALVGALLLSVATVYGDVLIKDASLARAFSGWPRLLLGAAVYGLTAFGWFFLMRHMKLSTLGVVYTVSCVLLLVTVSVLRYHEKVSVAEGVGIAMAVVSLALLARFA